jgi:DDE superfamily endonuclease
LLLQELCRLLDLCQPFFSQYRVFVRMRRQALGLLCALGSRTIARVLAATGRDQQEWSNEYRLFSRSPWQTRDLFSLILQQALPFTGTDAEPITLAGDFTHLPKDGLKIPGVSCMRDPLSPAFHTNLIYGLRFLQIGLICPFRAQNPALPSRCLPILFSSLPVVKKPGKKATDEEWSGYRAIVKKRPTSHKARQALIDLRADFDRAGAAARTLLVALDGSFCNRVLMEEPIERVELLCRCRKDAVLCRPARKGRKGFYGKRKFTPEQLLKNKRQPWQEIEFQQGGQPHTIRYKEMTGLLWQNGSRRRKLRLLVLAPQGYRLHQHGRLLFRQPAFILTTDLKTPAAKLIAAYLDRWQIEINHREEKTNMGVGHAQVRNVHSVPRQPSFNVAVYSLLLLAALKAYGPTLTKDYLPPPKWKRRPNARPSCLDIVALLRHQIAENPGKLADFEIDTCAQDLVVKAAA